MGLSLERSKWFQKLKALFNSEKLKRPHYAVLLFDSFSTVFLKGQSRLQFFQQMVPWNHSVMLVHSAIVSPNKTSRLSCFGAGHASFRCCELRG